MSDIELLRRFEPILRFNAGEMFLPCPVDAYVERCSLWVTDDKGRVRQLAARGELDLDGLADFGQAQVGHTMYLRFVQDEDALTTLDLQRWWLERQRGRFRGSGRLARVPLLARIADSMFDLSLAVRGTVPAGTAAAADVCYRELVASDSRRPYYGRVLRHGGWIILQYYYFFAMNDWRTGFHGANDHEGDWEQVHIYLYSDELGRPAPQWLACASHDFEGDDLRRRWDDPSLTIEGTHPVIFVGAGSHACYFEAGDYVLGTAPRFLEPVKRALAEVHRFWSEKLGQGTQGEFDDRASAVINVPFVDYARGDGVSIGPGCEESWTSLKISDSHGWVHQYRGLWGLDTRDPIGGERAPAGPRFERDGSVRLSWSNPLSWSGVGKLYPPEMVLDETRARIDDMCDRIASLESQIEEARKAVRDLALDVEAMRAAEYLSTVHSKKSKLLEERQEALRALQTELNDALDTREALSEYGHRLADGDLGSPTAHLRHPSSPAPPVKAHGRLVEVWAAMSGALALLAFVLLVLLQPPHWLLLVVLVALVVGAMEAWARGRLADYLLRIVLGLAIVAGLILVFEFWRLLLVALLAVVALHIMRDNLREAFER
jgi:hypothetical protein